MFMDEISELVNCLTGIDSLRELFSALNFDFDDSPVVKDQWSNDELAACKIAKAIATKNEYKIVYVQLNTNQIPLWKSIASKIIKNHRGLCIVCSHYPDKFKWVISILSVHFSQRFSESRHVPIVIHPNESVSHTFVRFLTKLNVLPNASAEAISAQASEAYNSLGTEIQGNLIENVFEALKTLSKGIVTDEKNHLELSDSALYSIRESVFILIYRIMFVLYAEDRAIFQLCETYYEQYSMQWIKDEVIIKNRRLPEYGIHQRLRNLFRLIEKGSEGIGHKPDEFYMRSYYGRLFDYNKHLQLEKFRIKNSDLIKAISLLSRTKDPKGNWFFLDYAGLETRHLGEVYEHLMERYLCIKNNTITEQSSLKERRTSGSYYTPPEIVDYILKCTIDPLVDKIIEQHPEPADQINHILKLNIVDPAMGSGHFLVGATNYLAKTIASIEHGEHVTDEVLVERKRDVARRCIYGVDLNPLAVDIAQVSLWLETLSSDKPLSFLDAHIKHGNSLFGSMLDNLFETQTTLSESVNAQTKFKEIIRSFTLLETMDDDTSQAVLTKTATYNDIRTKGSMYYNLKFLLDAKTARHLDPTLPGVRRFFDKMADSQSNIEHEFGNALPTTYSRKHVFFHWDLEFPGVFYSANGTQKANPGFDAVIGNPPYFNLPKTDVLKNHPAYNDISKGVTNIAACFIKQGCTLIRDHGYLSYIIPKSFLAVESWKPIRRFVLQHKLVSAHDVGKQWKDVALEQVVITLKKNSTPTTVSILANFKKIDDVPQQMFVERSAILTRATNDILKLICRIEEKPACRLANIAIMPRGLTVKSSEYITAQKPNFVRVLGGINIGRFFIKDGRDSKPNRFLLHDHIKIRDRKSIFGSRRIVYQNIGSTITATIVHNIPTDDTVNNLILNSNDYSYEGILALLNSKLMDFYLKFAIINNSKLTIHLDSPYLGMLPIVKPTSKIIRSTTTLLSYFDDLNRDFTSFMCSLSTGQQATLRNAGLIDVGLLSSANLSKNITDVFQLVTQDPFYDILQTSNEKITRLIAQINNDIYRLYKLNQSDVALIHSSLSEVC